MTQPGGDGVAQEPLDDLAMEIFSSQGGDVSMDERAQPRMPEGAEVKRMEVQASEPNCFSEPKGLDSMDMGDDLHDLSEMGGQSRQVAYSKPQASQKDQICVVADRLDSVQKLETESRPAANSFEYVPTLQENPEQDQVFASNWVDRPVVMD